MAQQAGDEELRGLDGIWIKAQVSAQELNMEEHLPSSIVDDLIAIG